MVDYVITYCELFNNINCFNVDDYSPWVSDHCPLLFEIHSIKCLGEGKKEKLEELPKSFHISERDNVLLERKCDDNEQYSRRTSLRINGIEVQEDEDGDFCVQSVERILGGIPGVVLPENSIERAHHVCKPRTGEDGKKNQQMIVKLKSWKVRNNIYKKRKGQQPVKVYLDLTVRRLNSKKLAIEKTNNCEHVAFVFTNINCRLTLRLTNGLVKYFSSEEELDNILSSLEEEV